MNTPFFYIILNIQISLVSAQTDNFDFLDQICPKSISSRKQKKWTSHWNSAYLNQSRYKCSAQTDNFEFLDQIFSKKYFHLKTTISPRLQAFAICVVNVNSTVVFKHFEDLKNLITLNILKEKLIMSCLLGSFYFKIVQSFSNSTALFRHHDQ